MCNHYKYLGIILQPSLTFSRHLKVKKSKVQALIGCLSNLHLTYSETTLKISRMKISPIITHSLAKISAFLKLTHFNEIDKVKGGVPEMNAPNSCVMLKYSGNHLKLPLYKIQTLGILNFDIRC